MEKEKINQLIRKYEKGETTLEEDRALHDFFRGKDVAEEWQGYANQFQYYHEMQSAEPAEKFDPLAKIDFEESEKSPFKGGKHQRRRGMTDQSDSGVLSWIYRIAAGFILLLIGYGTAEFMHSGDYATNRDMAELEQEVQQMKRALMNAGDYEYASAGERLSVINTSTRLSDDEQTLDRQITDILIYTMNNDDNVNVRVAAAEALFRFSADAGIKKALIHSLNQQDDPLMQITLIDMLVELKAKSAVNEMEKMLVDADTRDIVRERLKTGIAQLKA